MPKLHRYLSWFIIGIFAVILISACGMDTRQQSSSDTQLPSTECQNIQHQLGETCVPTNPQRVVATDEIALEMVLALGLKPIAAAEPNLVSSRSRHLAGKVDDVVSLGKQNQLSLERILQLNPDLIAGLDFSLVTYFDDLGDTYPWVMELPVAAISLDFTRGSNLNLIKQHGFPQDKRLGVGIVDGRNIWQIRTDKVFPPVIRNSNCNLKHFSTTISIFAVCSLRCDERKTTPRTAT